MTRLGLLDLLALGATLLFALPIGVFGVQLLLDGRTVVGLVGVAIAVGLVLVEQYLWTPGDVTGDVGSAIVSRLVGPADGKKR